MNNSTILITGANGFIGGELVKFFSGKGVKVFALARNNPQGLPSNAEYVKFDLKEKFSNEKIFENADQLIHCAYAKYSDKQKDSDKINIDGTKQLLELSRKHKLKKIIFLSTLSAHPDARSHYGKTKLFMESLFDSNKDLVLKPGLVLGNGGLYRTIEKIISKSKFIPMIGNGKQPVQPISINDLAELIKLGIEKNISGVFPAAGAAPITMKELYKIISMKSGKKNIFIPMPYWCAEFMVILAFIFHIKLPISKENIIGLKHNKTYDTSVTQEKFGIRFKNFRESIDGFMKKE
jgi:nucleoside-diphosphate-sugar epimerase